MKEYFNIRHPLNLYIFAAAMMAGIINHSLLIVITITAMIAALFRYVQTEIERIENKIQAHSSGKETK